MSDLTWQSFRILKSRIVAEHNIYKILHKYKYTYDRRDEDTLLLFRLGGGGGGGGGIGGVTIVVVVGGGLFHGLL